MSPDEVTALARSLVLLARDEKNTEDAATARVTVMLNQFRRSLLDPIFDPMLYMQLMGFVNSVSCSKAGFTARGVDYTNTMHHKGFSCSAETPEVAVAELHRKWQEWRNAQRPARVPEEV